MIIIISYSLFVISRVTCARVVLTHSLVSLVTVDKLQSGACSLQTKSWRRHCFVSHIFTLQRIWVRNRVRAQSACCAACWAMPTSSLRCYWLQRLIDCNQRLRARGAAAAAAALAVCVCVCTRVHCLTPAHILCRISIIDVGVEWISPDFWQNYAP